MEEDVEGGGEEEGEPDLGDEDPGEEEDPGRGKDGDAGVEASAGIEALLPPPASEQGEQKDGYGLREMGGEGVEAEDAEAGGDEPVGERRLFEIADTVDVESDPVSAGEDVAGGVGVSGVGVVEQRWGEERGEEDGGPKDAEDRDGRCAARGRVCP